MRCFSLRIRQICVCLSILTIVGSGAYGQSKKTRKTNIVQPGEALALQEKGKGSVENARVMLLTENIDGAIIAYSQLLSNDSLNILLNSEFAYALALNGLYDVALLHIDRIWNIKASDSGPVYFASRIYDLMGFTQLAADVMKDPAGNNTPSWIASKAAELNIKYKKIQGTQELSRDQVVENFRRANRLAAQGYNMQSIALFEEIVKSYPAEYLPLVGYSIALEKAGFYSRSLWAVETALKIVENDPAKLEAKKSLEKRLAGIRIKISSGQPGVAGPAAQQQVTPASRNGSIMLYAGGMISSAYTSVNTRVGYFMSESGSTSVDLGLSSFSGQTSFNFGLSYFQRHKIFVAGFGLNGTFGNNSTAVYSKLSVGVSFSSKRNKSSWDIFLDGQQPFKRELATIVGMSFGRSLYFGKRK